MMIILFGKQEIIGIYTNILTNSVIDILQQFGYNYIKNPSPNKHPDIIKFDQPDVGIEIKVSSNKFRVSAHHRYNTNILYGKLIVQSDQPVHFQGVFFTDQLITDDWYSLKPKTNSINVAKSYSTNLNSNGLTKLLRGWIFVECDCYLFNRVKKVISKC